MSNLNVRLKKILSDIEQNMQNKEDLEYVKSQILNLYNIFFDEINQLEKKAAERTSVIEKTQLALEEKVDTLQSKLKSMENELYINEDESDFSITCPYCGNEFIIDGDELKDEIECPECNNVIELDWENDDCSCGECGHDCSDCNHDSNDEDDM